VRIGIALVALALALPAAALAKGPTDATITGPGLSEPLKLGGERALAPGEPLEALMSRGGFFQVAWGGSPRRILDRSPTAGLGPKYEVVYVVPGPSGQTDLIRQDLYPYAEGGELTYTPPGQRFFGTRKTHGGWFRATAGLTEALVEAGLPTEAAVARSAAPPPADGGAPPGWPAALLAVVGLVVAATLLLRRRLRPAAA
jgi:hypothetical protein